MWRHRWTRATALLAVGAFAAGCGQGGLDPQGPGASRILTIGTALTVVGTLVAVLVLALWWWATRRAGREELAPPSPEQQDRESTLQRRFIIAGGIVLPSVVVAVFFGVQIAGAVAASDTTEEFTIEVTGHQYWWELDYPAVGGVDAFETANQLHIPTGTPVRMLLRSDDVIHSLWVPQLAGKADLVPGRESELMVEADRPGTYAGYCAEFCGLQHTWMKFEVVAMAPDEYRDWAAQQAEPAIEPADDLTARGQSVYLDTSCAACHSIRGVDDESGIGPDLTHLATRNELGAGRVPLDAGTLRAWVANTQTLKPGAHMPPQELTADELDALVAYLLSLE